MSNAISRCSSSSSRGGCGCRCCRGGGGSVGAAAEQHQRQELLLLLQRLLLLLSSSSLLLLLLFALLCSCGAATVHKTARGAYSSRTERPSTGNATSTGVERDKSATATAETTCHSIVGAFPARSNISPGLSAGDEDGVRLPLQTV